MTRILGIDPGLTRCGIGVIETIPGRRLELVHVDCARTSPDEELAHRLARIADAVEQVLDEYRPDRVALERVFAQHNVRTVMGVAQISGVVLVASERRGIPVALHTPSEVKAAVTGYGSADKAQVGEMVRRLLRLEEVPKPADAADALALAICSAWRAPDAPGLSTPVERARAGQTPLTPAQQAWLAAERSAKSARRRLR